MDRVLTRLVALVLLAALAGCSDPDDEADPAGQEPSPVAFDQELHDELLAMMDADQEARTGGGSLDGDIERTERLKEIIAEHGWPTYDLVGEDGEEAAWVIAQHSDLDPEFQAEALELLREAVADEQASPGNLAYLEDRVRAGRGDPQLYGTQMGCTRKGKPAEPEIEDPANLDERREAAGLPPYEDYIVEMTEACSAG